jgi:arylsulfatase A-like enzyme
MTGRNQVNFGFDNNPIVDLPQFNKDYVGLPLSEKTLADRLAELNYVNGIIGKWHLGDEPRFHPLKRGFNEFWGFTGGGHDYFISEPDGKGYKCPIECNYKTPQPITYITDNMGDECVDFIKRHKNEPFFLVASFNAPHGPFQATKEDLELFTDISNEKRRNYCGLVHRLDDNIGKILNAVEKEELDKNTLIVFISDNGGPVEDASVNVPFNGKKGTLLEGGIHVPFIMKWTGILSVKKTYINPVVSLDFAATFFELAGGKVTKNVKFDGVNLIPYIIGEIKDKPHESLLWRFTISAAIRADEWKLVRLPDRLPMLFNLSNDISEQSDVSIQQIDRTKIMLKKLGTWDVHQPQPVFFGRC